MIAEDILVEYLGNLFELHFFSFAIEKSLDIVLNSEISCSTSEVLNQ